MRRVIRQMIAFRPHTEGGSVLLSASGLSAKNRGMFGFITRIGRAVDKLIEKGQKDKAQFILRSIHAFVIIIASVLFPATQGYFQSIETSSKEMISRKEKILDTFSSNYQKYVVTYIEYIKMCEYVSSQDGRPYLGLPREKVSEFRLKALETILALPQPETMMTYIESYYSTAPVEQSLKKLLSATKSLTDIDPSAPGATEKANRLAVDIDSMFLELIKAMAIEIRNNIKR